MSIVAGSNRRRNIQGHTVQADPAVVTMILQLSSETLNTLFRQARDQGMAVLRLDDQPYILTRRPDHTYTILPQGHRYHPII